MRSLNQYLHEMVEDRERAEEEHLMCRIEETIGYEINRDELIQALNYDRDQYERGYADASGQSRPEMQWIKRPTRLGDIRFECPNCHTFTDERPGIYCGNCGVKMSNGYAKKPRQLIKSLVK